MRTSSASGCGSPAAPSASSCGASTRRDSEQGEQQEPTMAVNLDRPSAAAHEPRPLAPRRPFSHSGQFHLESHFPLQWELTQTVTSSCCSLHILSRQDHERPMEMLLVLDELIYECIIINTYTLFMIPESGERSRQDLSLRTAKFHVATITDDLHVLNAESSCLLILIAAPRHTSHCASKWTQA